MKFELEHPNRDLSPYSGMDREHWLEAGKFLLKGLFSHVKSLNDPIDPPRSEDQVSYPRPGDLPGRRGAARFEGLARSMCVAVPLFLEDENISVNGIKLRDYYAGQTVRGMSKGAETGFGRLQELIEETGGGSAFQQTVECGIMGLNLLVSKELIWDRYNKEEKEIVAAYLSEYGHYQTCDSNWRFFNLLTLTFLKTAGYEVDEVLYRDHLDYLLSLYAGDGWYRDGNLFDYYSAWEFVLDAALWCHYYGYQWEPEAAAVFEANIRLFLSSYWRIFSENGESILWGRSGTYRFCASSALCAGGFLKGDADSLAGPAPLSYGAARRLMSGNLLQFITKEEMFIGDIPCLGFYGPFSPMVQSYSCASSPFWCGKAFLCLVLEKEHPFWQAKEENLWEQDLEPVRTLTGPGICFVNHRESGITEIKTAKFLFEPSSDYLPAYARVAFSSALPWEKMSESPAQAMTYQLNGKVPASFAFCKEEKSVLYRTAFFDVMKSRTTKVDMADIKVPFGTLRIDRVRTGERPFTLTLGHFGLPVEDGLLEVREGWVEWENRKFPYLIAKSKRFQTGIVLHSGWQKLSYVIRENVNAVCKKSCLLYASYTREQFYDRSEALVALYLTKGADLEFTEEELTAFAGRDRVDFTGADGLVCF